MLIVSFVEWSGAFQRPQHMALGFARRGWDVTYLSPGYVHRRGQQVDSGLALPANLAVLRPPALPGARKLDAIGRLNERFMLRAADRALAARGGGHWDVLIFNDPRWSGLAARIPARRRLWDSMDDLTLHAPGQDWIERKTRRAFDIADRIWTGTASLADRWQGRHDHIRFIPCGVEGRRFAEPDAGAVGEVGRELKKIFQASSEEQETQAPLAGYFGAVNERVDMDLLDALAGEGWRVLLIGPGSSQTRPLPERSNLRWIGPRPYADLPAWLAHMDLALIPYDTGGPHRYLYPVKALEYLAGGKPVLSTPLPDVVRFLKDYALLESESAGWRRVAREWPSLRLDAGERARRGQRYALGRSWEAMIDEMNEELNA